jgi:hypothetical protein
VTSEIIEVVLVVAGVFVIVVFLYNLISPNWDRGDEIAESFLGILEGQIEIADSEGTGEFSFWGLESSEEENLKYSVVYFGDRNSVLLPGYEDVSFVSKGNNKNNICICSWDLDNGFTSCRHCKDLELPVIFSLDSGEVFIGEGRKIGIVNEKTHYNFIVEPKPDSWLDYAIGCIEPELEDIPGEIACETDYSECKLTSEAVELLKNANGKLKEGYELIVTSAYRSYGQQKKMYDSWKKLGKESGFIEVAKPSCVAPHVTGNAVDLILQNGGEDWYSELDDIMFRDNGWVRYREETKDEEGNIIKRVMHYECCNKRYADANEVGANVVG